MTNTTYAHNQVLTADQLNTDFARTIDRAGDNMTGFLRLFQPPRDPMDACTKQYADSISAVSNAAILTFFANLPTSDAGLTSGSMWWNGGFLCRVP